MDNSDREGPHYCWRIILLLIGLQLASQPKVKLPHVVVACVVVPHICKYLTDQAEVFIDRSLLDRLPLRGKKAGTDALVENMEERNGVLNVFEVGAIFSQLQKCRHCHQAVESLLKKVAEKPLVIACCTA